MILLTILGLVIVLCFLVALSVYVHIGVAMWVDLTPITFDHGEFRDLYYGYYRELAFTVWLHTPEHAPTVERITRAEIEQVGGTIGIRYKAWHSYHGVPIENSKLKRESWWALYKHRIL